MLSSDKKISSQEFNNFYKKAQRKFSKNFIISLISSKTKQKTKFAVVVSKKLIKTAVLRHKNKRKIYKILSQLYPQFSNIKYGFILLQNNIENIDEVDLEKELSSLLF